MTVLESFYSVQNGMTALACCEFIKKHGLYNQLREVLDSDDSTDAKIQFIQYLRFAQYIHFDDELYNPEIFEKHLSLAGKLLEKNDMDPLLEAQYWSEQSLYRSRRANQLQDEEKNNWMRSALEAAKRAILLLNNSNSSIEELYRAHTYAANQLMLSNDLEAAAQHFKKTSELEKQVNSTYKFGNRLYRIRYYSLIGNEKRKDQCLEECRQLLETVTSLFDKIQLREILANTK